MRRGDRMDNRIMELQQNLFGGLHDFHTERTAAWLEAVREEFGDPVLEVVQNKGVDTYGLYRWHLERMLSWIEALADTYGTDVLDIIINQHRTDRREQGAQLAKASGKNALEDIIPVFSNGNNDNIIEKDDKQVLIKTTNCLAGKIAHDINKREMVYALHCNLDKDFVEGFNSDLGCEVMQTLMDGHNCCIHRIFYKDAEVR